MPRGLPRVRSADVTPPPTDEGADHRGPRLPRVPARHPHPPARHQPPPPSPPPPSPQPPEGNRWGGGGLLFFFARKVPRYYLRISIFLWLVFPRVPKRPTFPVWGRQARPTHPEAGHPKLRKHPRIGEGTTKQITTIVARPRIKVGEGCVIGGRGGVPPSATASGTRWRSRRSSSSTPSPRPRATASPRGRRARGRNATSPNLFRSGLLTHSQFPRGIIPFQ